MNKQYRIDKDHIFTAIKIPETFNRQRLHCLKFDFSMCWFFQTFIFWTLLLNITIFSFPIHSRIHRIRSNTLDKQKKGRKKNHVPVLFRDSELVEVRRVRDVAESLRHFACNDQPIVAATSSHQTVAWNHTQTFLRALPWSRWRS